MPRYRRKGTRQRQLPCDRCLPHLIGFRSESWTLPFLIPQLSPRLWISLVPPLELRHSTPELEKERADLATIFFRLSPMVSKRSAALSKGFPRSATLFNPIARFPISQTSSLRLNMLL